MKVFFLFTSPLLVPESFIQLSLNLFHVDSENFIAIVAITKSEMAIHS